MPDPEASSFFCSVAQHSLRLRVEYCPVTARAYDKQTLKGDAERSIGFVADGFAILARSASSRFSVRYAMWGVYLFRSTTSYTASSARLLFPNGVVFSTYVEVGSGYIFSISNDGSIAARYQLSVPINGVGTSGIGTE